MGRQGRIERARPEKLERWRAGEPDETRRVRIPVLFQGSEVGELWVDGEADRAFLERVALLVSAHVLIGWDTRGEAWEP